MAAGLTRPRLTLLGLVLLAGTALALFLRSSSASTPIDPTAARPGGGRPLIVGFADHLYGVGSKSEKWLGRTRAVNADIIRVNMYWSLVGFDEPENPRDPADPAYNWSRYDTAISNAARKGFEIDLTVLAAPGWAEGPRRPPRSDLAPAGSWKPDAGAFGDFAHAVARRYSGKFDFEGETLPRVGYFEAWNEPNLHTYITPQFNGRRNASAAIYVRLLNAFYEEVKAVDPTMQVVTGGTSPYGDPPADDSTNTAPLAFYRELLCLDGKLRRKGCAAGQRPKFDVIAHHPINREDPPTAHADGADEIQIGDFGELRKVLRKAEKLGTTGTEGRHELWANEVWWQTDPPDPGEGVSLKTHARWTAQALYLLWKQGASNVSFLQVRDAKYTPGESTLESYQTGVYTAAGKRKPSASAVAFPFVTDRKGGGLLAWGVAPVSGEVTIEAKGSGGGGGFRRVTTVQAQEGEVFTKRLRLSGALKLRARVGKARSLVWDQR